MSSSEKRDLETSTDEGLGTSYTTPSAETEKIDVEANVTADTLPEGQLMSPGTNPNEVDWDGPNDPQNPQNWSVSRRGVIVGMAMSIVFST